MASADAFPKSAAKRRRSSATGGQSEAALAELAASSSASSTLPICEHRDSILEAVRNHRVVVLVGETGSGKTTQVPQFLHEAGFSDQGFIAVTQPRRIAAISVAARVASEMKCDVGGLVGVHVRFHNRTSRDTKVKFMTDGMLVRESVGTMGLSACSVVVLDEAHERSVNTDLLLGLVHQALQAPKKRGYPELRVVVMSATIDATPFVNFFGGASNVKLLNVPGRLHPIDVFYTPTPEPDFLESALITLLQIHVLRPAGDVLVFLPGQEDIEGLKRLLEEKCELLRTWRREMPTKQLEGPAGSLSFIGGRMMPRVSDVDDFVVRPIFAALPFDQQELVFAPPPPNCRKIVLATNIAETSITIPGIRYVVDVGLVKMKICHQQTGVEVLKTVETSRASADQRAGRAGREAPGEVYRLYVESEYEKMPLHTPAEILRCEAASLFLQLKSLGVDDVGSFPLVDRPPQEALVKAAGFLCRIGALDRGAKLTEVGKRLGMLPIHPQLSYLLLTAWEFGCAAEMLSIVAMLSTETPFFFSQNRGEAAPASRPLLCEEGDHLSLLSMYSQWHKAPNKRDFVRMYALNQTALERAAAIRGQLKDLVQTSWGMKTVPSCGGVKHWVVVRRCLLKACFMQTAKLDEMSGSSYSTLLTRQDAKLHPSSVLFRKRPLPPCVVYFELVTTTKNYLRTVTEVDASWLTELCPQYFTHRAT